MPENVAPGASTAPAPEKRTKEVEFEYEGKKISLKYYVSIPRMTRNQCLEEAVWAWQVSHTGNKGFSPTVFEAELVKRTLKSWSESGEGPALLPPEPLPLGWEMLVDDKLANKIVELIGVAAIMKGMVEQATEVQTAKN